MSELIVITKPELADLVQNAVATAIKKVTCEQEKLLAEINNKLGNQLPDMATHLNYNPHGQAGIRMRIRIKEVAELLGISPSTVRARCDKKNPSRYDPSFPKFTKEGTAVLWWRDEIIAYNNKTNSSEDAA